MFLGLGEQKEEQKPSLQALSRGWLLCFVPLQFFPFPYFPVKQGLSRGPHHSGDCRVPVPWQGGARLGFGMAAQNMEHFSSRHTTTCCRHWRQS